MPTPRLFDSAARAAGQAATKLAKDPQALLDAANLNLTDLARSKVLARLQQMPKAFRRTYLAALKGTRRQAAIRSFCLMCMGWQRTEVPLCTDPACPLYPYRLAAVIGKPTATP